MAGGAVALAQVARLAEAPMSEHMHTDIDLWLIAGRLAAATTAIDLILGAVLVGLICKARLKVCHGPSMRPTGLLGVSDREQ